MKNSVRTISVIGALLVMVFFLTAGFMAYQSQSHLQHSRKLVIKTSQLIIQLKSVLSTLKDCETGQRGYVITGDPTYLEPYEKCRDVVQNKINRLEELINGDTQDRKNVEELRKFSAIKLYELHRTIVSRRDSGFEAARTIVSDNSGRQAMDQMRRLIGKMEDKQEQLLEQRLNDLDREFETSRIYSLVLIGLGTSILFGMLLLIGKLVSAREMELAILRETQRILADREIRLSSILDTAAEGIISTNGAGIIESVNSAAYKIFKYQAGVLERKNISELLPQFSQLIDGSEAITLNDKGVTVETTGLNSDGTELPVELAYNSTEVNGKKIITSIIRDITERKVIERRVSEFYSTVSHELRTPLTSIRGSLSLMDGGRAGELSPRAQQLVKVARSESERLIRLINDILDIKKIESGKLELRIEPIEVKELVNESIAGIYGFAEQANVRITPQVDALGILNCDKDRVEQVLANLISNAIKFSPPKGEIVVRVSQNPNGNWRFSVTDHGQGIAEEELHKLFGLFQQLDPSDSRRKGGTGLGLAICKALVEKHGGKIGVESKPGRGSIFWFELPNAKSAAKSTVFSGKPSLLCRSASTVLIVEDDKKLSILLSMMLEGQNFVTVQAGSISEAEQYINKNGNPDVIILDLTLPDGDGLELMEKLHHDGKTAHIPIVIVSARDPQDAYAHPLLIDWIKKPFDERRLLSALALAIRKRPNGKARVLIVEDDQPTREVIKQNLESLNVEFIEATDGVTAVYYARSHNPDLIVLDLGLPSLDGFEVIEILRRENLHDTPLIVYTAKDLTENDKRELTLGLTSHLIKSHTSEEEFLDTVKNMLNGLLEKDKISV